MAGLNRQLLVVNWRCVHLILDHHWSIERRIAQSCMVNDRGRLLTDWDGTIEFTVHANQCASNSRSAFVSLDDHCSAVIRFGFRSWTSSRCLNRIHKNLSVQCICINDHNVRFSWNASTRSTAVSPLSYLVILYANSQPTLRTECQLLLLRALQVFKSS